MMKSQSPLPPSLAQIKPLVRYVDDEQAILETHFRLKARQPLTTWRFPKSIRVLLEIDTDAGFHDENFEQVSLTRGCGMVTMKLVIPQRWWPAGMGDQTLYHIKLTLLAERRILDTMETTIGLISVRPSTTPCKNQPFLVNGQPCEINTIVPMDHVHENTLLPVSGHSLILVRDHYGPDRLFDAADRAGILMIQCIPIDAQGQPETQLVEQIPRLVGHPSLAGWCVSAQGHLGRIVRQQIQQLDPTHAVFEDFPEDWAA